MIILTREMAAGEAVGGGGKLRPSLSNGMKVTRPTRLCIISVTNRHAVASVSTTTCGGVLPTMASAANANLGATSIRREHQTEKFMPAIDTELSV